MSGALSSRGLSKSIGGNFVLLVLLGIGQVAFEYTAGALASTADFEGFVLLRSIWLVFSALASLGLNEVLVRRGASEIPRGVPIAIASLGVTSLFALLLPLVPFEIFRTSSLPAPWLLAASSLAFCVLQVAAAVSRTEARYQVAILERDGWRVLLWATLPLSAAGLGLPEACALVLLVAAVLGGARLFRRIRRWGEGLMNWPLVSRSDLRMAMSFWAAMASLVGVTYADQVLLGALAVEGGVLKTYALGVTLLVTPYALLGTAVGAVLLPSVARGYSPQLVMARFVDGAADRRWVLLAVIGAVAAVWGHAALATHLLHRIDLSPSPWLIALLLLTGSVRVAFSVPSSVLGARGSQRDLDRLAVFSVVGVGLQLGGVVLGFKALGITGVAAATALSWIYRLWVSSALAMRCQPVP